MDLPRFIMRGAAVLIAAFVIASTASAVPAAASGPSPAHIITCNLTVYTPVNNPGGIRVGGNVNCSDRPDARWLWFKVWRCSPFTQNCTQVGERMESTSTNPFLELEAIYPCSAGKWSYHVQGHSEALHGNWDFDDKDGGDAIITC